MALVKLDLNPDRKTLRQFGLIAFIAFGLLGGWTLFRGTLLGFELGTAASTTGWMIAGVGLASGLLALLFPAPLRFLYVGLMVLTFPIGFVVSHVILMVLYYLVLTPLGLLMRVFGFDPMYRKLEPQAATYWNAKAPRTDIRDYFKQY